MPEERRLPGPAEGPSTGSSHALVALAVLFAPDRALALLARLAGQGAVESVKEAGRLVAGSRRERLSALAAAVPVDRRALVRRVEALAALERPRIAAIARDIAAGAPPRAAPALVRLCRERIGP